MSEGRTPSPDFDETRYERPNKKWLCGNTCDGCPCRIGPSPSGECRATTECNPQLVVPPGETKGTWKCTRPKDWGGACPEGPLPDGSCCKSITPCNPVRSLRARRGLFTRAAVIASVAFLLICLGGGLRESFINPAPLSTPHTGPEFARLAAEHAGISVEAAGQGCVACHSSVSKDFATLTTTATSIASQSLSLKRLMSPHPRDFSKMDASCSVCHEPQTFHQANVDSETSCSVCHLEHKGNRQMAMVDSKHCADCHGDAARMKISTGFSYRLSASLFTKEVPPGVIMHAMERPADGFTKPVTSFAKDHPEFRVLAEKSTDTNTLKFNHALHLNGESIPPLNGRPLDCASCHQPDASGAFMQRITFEQNCRACHSLNIDETTPGLELPHGNASFVRAFLRSLPTQYADHATRKLGITGSREIDAFVKEKIAGLRKRTLSGENLERAVFFADAATGEATVIAGVRGVARARFAGCAYCHEVIPQSNATPLITEPRTPDRWLQHAAFNHAKHTAMKCTDCHATNTSFSTADIILPTQQSCVTCHSPKGGSSDSCMTCHTYHNSKPVGLDAARQILLLQ